MKRKGMALFLAVLMMVIAFSGCGGPKSQTDAKTGETTTQEEAGKEETKVVAELEPVKLNYWILSPGKQKDSDAVWKKFNEELAEVLPNTTVEFVPIEMSQWAEKWSKAMAAREQIDISWLGWLNNLNDEINNGSIMPLDNLLTHYGQDILGYFGKTAIDMHRAADGDIYQVPAWQGLLKVNHIALFPKKVVDEVSPGIVEEIEKVFLAGQYNSSLEARESGYIAVEKYLAAAKEKGMLGQGYKVNSLDAWLTVHGVCSVAPYAYVAYEDNSFKVVSVFQSELYKMHYKYMADWYKKGYIRSDAASVQSWANTWNVDGVNSYIMDVQGVTGYVDPVAIYSEKYNLDLYGAMLTDKPQYALGTATGTSIPTTSKNPERAMMLMNLLYSEKGKNLYRTFVYGIEGMHYNKLDNDTIDLLTGSGEAGSDWTYGNWAWTLGTCEFVYDTQAGGRSIYQLYREQEKEAYADPLLQFAFDNSKVSTEQAQLKTVVDEYNATLNCGATGEKWEDNYLKFTEKLKQAGIDTFIAEVQRQLDEFVAANGSKW